MSARPILLFDVMETLVTEPFPTVMPPFFGMTLDEFRQARHPTAWIEFEKGRLSEAEYFARMFQEARPVDGAGLRTRLREAYGWLEGMQQILIELHAAGYEIHALSNYPVWYEMIERKLQLSRYLRWTFVSWKTGLRKPDLEAYVHAIAYLDVPASECLFVDDRTVNVQAAREVGMDAILKEDARQVRAELVGRRLLGR
jgi:HAD superfamily hydrolase (TIGR01509 family)